MGILSSIMGGGKMPAPPPIPPVPPAANPSTMADPKMANAGATNRARAAGAAADRSGTNPTGPAGLSTPPLTAPATLLGGTR